MKFRCCLLIGIGDVRKESDYIILIIAGKYGTIDKDKKIGFTEKEYDYAKSCNKPILAFLHNDIKSLCISKCEKSDAKMRRLEVFRAKVENDNRLVKYYSNIDDLKYKVAQALSSAKRDTPGIGWIRANRSILNK